MRTRCNNILFILLAFASTIVVSSCADETFDPSDLSRLPDNMIGFDVSSGLDTHAYSRSTFSDNSDADLPPVVLTQDSDTLYIHRYVAPESERATGRNTGTGTSRAPQINTVDDFKKRYGEFYVQATHKKEDYIPLSKAEPFAIDDAGDVWYIKEHHYYWPTKKELLFNAFAPATAKDLLKGINLADEKISFSYTVPLSKSDPRTDAEVQPDIMFASTTCSRNKGTVNGNYAPLNFRHALSAIKFAVRDVANGEIIDITIKGVAGSGTCTFNPDAVSAPAFVWSNLGKNEAEYTQAFKYETEEKEYSEIPDLENATVINDLEGMNDKTFMLIPQSIPDDAELIITFKKADEAGSKKLKGKLKTSDISVWEAGKEYIYTISTTSDVWTYVFEVIGSEQEEKTYNTSTHNWDNGKFIDNETKIEIGAAVTEGAYYKVQSYRYRTSNSSIKEILPWTAEASDGNNTVPSKFENYKDKIPMTVNRANWLLDNWTYQDDGSVDPKLFNDLVFASQYIATDYDGDWGMRGKGDKYGSKDKPVDLSLVYDGETINTANCYVVNAGGWYSIPLYYGSSMKKGKDIISTYTNNDYEVKHGGVSYPSLTQYIDYAGNDIKSAKIDETLVKDAILVWQDAYGIIDQCKYDENIKQIVFHVDPTYLQQANCVLAIRDAAKDIIWSWHIWVTDHWVNDESLKLGVGDVTCEAENPKKGPFDLAPYNLGWCDPKNVLYLKRSGKITFKQTEKDKTTVRATKTLDVIQRAEEIEYWIGNSVYYQFGRKDPMVGFINDESQEKHHYGEKPYEVKATGDIKECILHPNAFFENNVELLKYYNLWNNYNSDKVTISGNMTITIPNKMIAPETLKKFENGELTVNSLSFNNYTESGEATIESGNPNLDEDFAYSANKTIYDPSPVGYVVPPCDFFKIFAIGSPNSGALFAIENYDFFKGDKKPIEGHEHYFNYTASPKRDHTGDKTVIFNVNGQKRYSWLNMNQSVVYLWSNTAGFYESGLGLGFCLGYDTNGIFSLDSYFQATRLIARPVRCIKEF